MDDKIELSKYEMPPIPPDGIFDVRYTTGRMLEVVQKETKDYPITIRWKIEDGCNKASLIVDGKEISLSKSGTTQISNPTSEIKLRLSASSPKEFPKEFALHQNYPNPFNPTTTIKYQLPVDSRVMLKIYNLLGQEVKTLIDDIQDAGYKSIEWDVSHIGIASGVYFYRLTAESLTKSFVAVKKLLLMK